MCCIHKSRQPALREEEMYIYEKDKYKKFNLEKEVQKMVHLDDEQRALVLEALTKNEEAFQGNKCEWKGEKVDFELGPGTKLYIFLDHTLSQNPLKDPWKKRWTD